MASLMVLPVEVRAIIIDLVISSRRQAWQIPRSSETLKEFKCNDYYPRGWEFPQKAFYGPEQEHYLPNGSALLLANRQLHLETLTRLSREPVRYELNAVLVDDLEFDLTWTYIPCISKQVDQVTAVMWSYGHPYTVYDTAFQSHQIGRPPPISWHLYGMLERFLWLGASPPRDETAPPPKSRDYSINHLELEVLTPELLAEDCELLESSDYNLWHFCVRRVRVEQGRDPMPEALRVTMDPRWFASVIEYNLDDLLCMSYHTAWFAAMWFESVGTITLSLDGDIIRRFDLGEMLADFPPGGPAGSFEGGRQENFEEWRKYATRVRRERGLPNVVD